MEQEYVIIGKITAPYSYRGEVRVLPLTDFPQRFGITKHVFLSLSGQLVRIAVESAFVQENRVILKLSGIDSLEQASKYRGALIQVPRQEVWPLGEGAYYHFEIIGLSVITENGEALGVITEVLETGGNDVYVIKSGSGKEVLLPALKEIVKRIDTEAGHMIIRPLPGLLESDQK